MFHSLGAVEDVLALLWRHAVEHAETVAHALLHLRGEIVKARLPLERPLLLRNRHRAVVAHPLREMLLAGPWTYGSALRRLIPLLRIAASALRSTTLNDTSGRSGGLGRREESAEKNAAYCSGKKAPDWGEAAHWRRWLGG